MEKQNILSQTEAYVKSELSGEGTGHDWWHIHRVRNTALAIAKEENADLFIVEMSALLHDIGDPKLHNGDITVAPRLIGAWLDKMEITGELRQHIMFIIGHMSFSKSLEGKEVEKSVEFKCVQDADRLDAVGAVGIGRCFSYGGNKGRIMHDPDIKPREKLTVEEYRGGKDRAPTINHFYEKLLLLKDKMNTDTGKKVAEGRHVFMEQYLEQFYNEWEGKA